MCECMAGIQSATAEIRREKKKDRKKKPQGTNIMVCPTPEGDHNEVTYDHADVCTAHRTAVERSQSVRTALAKASVSAWY